MAVNQWLQGIDLHLYRLDQIAQVIRCASVPSLRLVL
jgi:hypothetical protein